MFNNKQITNKFKSPSFLNNSGGYLVSCPNGQNRQENRHKKGLVITERPKGCLQKRKFFEQPAIHLSSSSVGFCSTKTPYGQRAKLASLSGLFPFGGKTNPALKLISGKKRGVLQSKPPKAIDLTADTTLDSLSSFQGPTQRAPRRGGGGFAENQEHISPINTELLPRGQTMRKLYYENLIPDFQHQFANSKLAEHPDALRAGASRGGQSQGFSKKNTKPTLSGERKGLVRDFKNRSLFNTGNYGINYEYFNSSLKAAIPPLSRKSFTFYTLPFLNLTQKTLHAQRARSEGGFLSVGQQQTHKEEENGEKYGIVHDHKGAFFAEQKKPNKLLRWRSWFINIPDNLSLGGTSLKKRLSLKKRSFFNKHRKLRRVTARFSGGIKIHPRRIIRQGCGPIYVRKQIHKYSLNEYQNQFKTKQSVKVLYGRLSEKSFKLICRAAKIIVKNRHSTQGTQEGQKLWNRPRLGASLISLLERRLDVLVFRLGIAKSLRKARILIKAGLISVDMGVIRHPSFIARVGSAIQFTGLRNLGAWRSTPEGISQSMKPRTQSKKHYKARFLAKAHSRPMYLINQLCFLQSKKDRTDKLTKKAGFIIKHPTESLVGLPRTLSFKTLKHYGYRY